MGELDPGLIMFGAPERDPVTPGLGLVTEFDPLRGKLRIDGLTARHANRRQVWVTEEGFELGGEPLGGPDDELTTAGEHVFRTTDEQGEIIWGTIEHALPVQGQLFSDTSVS